MNKGSVITERYDSTPSSQATALEPDMLIRTAELRDAADLLSESVVDLHVRQQRDEIGNQARELAHRIGVPEMLETISFELGFSWSLTARLLGVTTAAIRKWRKGGSTTPENRLAIAEVIAFARVVQRVQPTVNDIPFWMETPLTDETTLTPSELYSRGALTGLVDLAADRESAEQLLDEVSPDWRKDHPADSRYRVVTAPDGIRSIVPAS